MAGRCHSSDTMVHGSIRAQSAAFMMGEATATAALGEYNLTFRDPMGNTLASFVDLGPVVWELRLTKSPAEIALLRQAAGVADEAMRRTAKTCVRGASQRVAAKVAVAAYVELGADPSPPGPISAGRGWDWAWRDRSAGPRDAGRRCRAHRRGCTRARRR